MIRVHAIDQIPQGLRWPVVTIGSFDGVHRGHRALIDRTRALAAPHGGESVVVTFKPHPVSVLAPEHAPLMLTAWEDKYARLEAAGADVCVEVPFDAAFADWSAERFVTELLVERIGARHVVAGPDLRFGKGRGGDFDLLERLGPAHRFEASSIEPVTHGGAVVSSSRIRDLVARGQVAEAATLLTCFHRLRGVVVSGDARGRTIGFPTANLNCAGMAIPANGIYATRCTLPDGRVLQAATSIGVRPTFGENARAVEAHLLDFEGDLYGQELALDFVAHLRPEERYDSVEALIAQIDRDVQKTREVLA